MKKNLFLAALLALALPALPQSTSAAEIGPSLKVKLASMQAAAQSQPTRRTSRRAQSTVAIAPATTTVIITFNTVTGLQESHLALLASKGIPAAPASQLPRLGMVAAKLTAAQINELAAEPSIISLWANDPLRYDLHQARVLSGVDKLRADAGMTARNGGKVVDGTGDGSPTPEQPNRPQFSAVVIDSGIDTRNVDLPFDFVTSATGTVPTTKVIQNVQVNASEGEEGTPPTINYVEHLQQNDSVGHGTHVSGIVGGTGRFSRTTAATTGPNGEPTGPGVGTFEDFSGAAGGTNGAADTGVKIVGCGSGAGLFILSALGGFEYALQNQVKYNVRLTNNSYGSDGDYNAAQPLNVAIKNAYDAGIISAFSAGNSGPSIDTIGQNAKSPYVICVAAGTKEGGLASFSSRGLPASERTPGSVEEFNLPAINAPGTGREFDYNAPGSGKGFYSDMISTRADIPGAATGLNDQEFPAPYQANYTQISGTSMSCPFTVGTIALLLDANPNLTFTQVKAILQDTATHMPGYADFEMGAGYVNVFAAVDEAFNPPAKPYKAFTLRDPQDFLTSVARNALAAPNGGARPIGYPPAPPPSGTPANNPNPPFNENFRIMYTPGPSAQTYAAAKTKAATNDDSYAFLIDANADGTPNTSLPSAQRTSNLDVRIQFGKNAATGETGNSLGFNLWAPDGTFYASGPALPVLDAPSRQVVVKNPISGLWVMETRGVRGLAAVPVNPPTGAAAPDTVDGQIFRANFSITDPQDITELPQADAVRFALANRFMDTLTPGGTQFFPTRSVTRLDFLKALVINTPLRQSLAASTPRFTDLSPTESRWAEAAAQPGSTLRDWDFTPGPILGSGPTTFNPNMNVSRLQVAVSLVRGLGLDREALALSGTTVTVNYNGTPIAVSDAAAVPAESRGYLQLALNRGILTYYPRRSPGSSTTQIFVYPTKPLIRADLAVALGEFRQIFSQGNNLEPSEEPAPPES